MDAEIVAQLNVTDTNGFAKQTLHSVPVGQAGVYRISGYFSANGARGNSVDVRLFWTDEYGNRDVTLLIVDNSQEFGGDTLRTVRVEAETDIEVQGIEEGDPSAVEYKLYLRVERLS